MTRDQIVELIRQRSGQYDLNPDVAVRIAELESSLNPNAKNKRSSARGLYQLTKAQMSELGLDPKKPLTVEQQVDAGLQSLSISQDYLRKRLERQPEPYEIYAAHFSGRAGALKVLQADPNKEISSSLSPRAMRANPKLKGKTHGETVQTWRDKFGAIGQTKPGKPFNPMAPYETTEPAPLQLYAASQQEEPPVDEAPMPPQAVAMAGEPTAFMAEGGEVGNTDARLIDLIDRASSEDDYRRINAMVAKMQPVAMSRGGDPADVQDPYLDPGYEPDSPRRVVDKEPEKKTARQMLAESRLTDQELKEASKVAFGVYPSSGKGRKKGEISKALESGEGQVAFAKGLTMLPQNIVGAPVDLINLGLTPLGLDSKKPVMGSEWLKERSREAGMAFPEPTDPTLRGFYSAGDIASNLINPAAATRGVARGAEKAGQALGQAAVDFQAYNQALGPAGASYVSRPKGFGTALYTKPPSIGSLPPEEEAKRLFANPTKDNPPLSPITAFIESSLPSRQAARSEYAQPQYFKQMMDVINRAPDDIAQKEREKLKEMNNFWINKVGNYLSKQAGTVDDPIRKMLVEGDIPLVKELSSKFRGYAVKAASEGTSRVDPVTGERLFYPKDPEAVQDLTRAYDEAIDMRTMVPTRFDDKGRRVDSPINTQVTDLMLSQRIPTSKGSRAPLFEEINPQFLSVGIENRLGHYFPEGRYGADLLKNAYDALFASNSPTARAALDKLGVPPSFNPPKTLEGLSFLNGNNPDRAKLALARADSPEVETVAHAILKDQPIYDINPSHYGSLYQTLLDDSAINPYLATLSTKQIKDATLESVVREAAKVQYEKLYMEDLVSRIKAGKPVPNTVFEKGVSAPLKTYNEGPFEGYAWKKIEDAEATAPEGAYIGHSVGGYSKYGSYPSGEKQKFRDGEHEVYTLRDARNRPVTTVLVEKDLDTNKTYVQQIKGDGARTGNTAPEKHGDLVLDFLYNVIKPVRVLEHDNYLTPGLQSYKNVLEAARKNPTKTPPPARQIGVPGQAGFQAGDDNFLII